MQCRTSRDAYMLRLPAGWREAVKAEAKKAHRSMNGEIIAAIEAHMTSKGVKLQPKHEKDRQGGHPDGLKQSQL